jgi:hypothetical protein
MKTIKYHGILDRTSWKRGEWDKEPDKIQYEDEATGLPCLIVRNHFGALCGYVGVSFGHPYYGKDYHEIDLEVHGGLTYSEFCQEKEGESGGICHIPEPGEPAKVWWLDFDCAHAWDVIPSFHNECLLYGSTYKNIDFVKEEIALLARQVKEAENDRSVNRERTSQIWRINCPFLDELLRLGCRDGAIASPSSRAGCCKGHGPSHGYPGKESEGRD